MNEPEGITPEVGQEEPPEERLFALAADIGFVESEELSSIRTKLARGQSPEESTPLIIEWQERARELVDKSAPESYTTLQVGLLIASAGLYSENGFIDAAREDILDAMSYAQNLGEMGTYDSLALILEDLPLPPDSEKPVDM